MFKTYSFPTSGGDIYFVNGRWPIVCGHTDMRCGIDGLAGIITNKYNLDLFNDALFLFCGRKKDRFKALYWDKDGFILLYKRIEKGNLQ